MLIRTGKRTGADAATQLVEPAYPSSFCPAAVMKWLYSGDPSLIKGKRPKSVGCCSAGALRLQGAGCGRDLPGGAKHKRHHRRGEAAAPPVSALTDKARGAALLAVALLVVFADRCCWPSRIL